MDSSHSLMSLEVKDLGKLYRLHTQRTRYRTLREEAVGAFKTLLGGKNGTKANKSLHWAIKDISFAVNAGEVLGVIGRNGAGKSTLLKILSRITEPTCGTACLRGRVGSLLEVGTGFHHELTGRENVYLNGAILGMSKQEIDRKFDEIVSFAEVERFLDTPVKHYSSGMSVRLAFAVAAHLNTDIMLIDEVLAVGDAGFQRKCATMLRRSIRDGRTAIIVSHNMGLIRTLCSRAIMLESGKVYTDGPTDQVIQTYHQHVLQGEGSYRAEEQKTDKPLFVLRAYLSDIKGSPINDVPCGAPFRLNLLFSSRSGGVIQRPKIHVKINGSNGEYLSFLGSRMAGYELSAIGDRSLVVCELPDPNLGPGDYYIGFTVSDGQVIYDQVENALNLTMTTSDYFGSGDLPQAKHGRVLLKSRWWTEHSEKES